MATYPPNQTTPAKGSGNYLWNWLGSSLKKFGQAISPYITGGGGEGYKKYVALLTQSGTDAPVATVLENTLGSDIVWYRFGVGCYYGVNSNLTDPNRVFISFTGCYSGQGNGNIPVVSGEIYDGTGDGVPGYNLWFYTRDSTATNGTDNWGAPIFVEIRVYP